jgi:hypothetical protein
VEFEKAPHKVSDCVRQLREFLFGGLIVPAVSG